MEKSFALFWDILMCVKRKDRKREREHGHDCVLASLYLSTVPQHGVWWFGQLLSTNDLENELLLGAGWKRVIAEWIK